MIYTKANKEKNDFWNDCLKDNQIININTKHSKSKEKVRNYPYMNFIKNSKCINKRKKNKLYKYNSKPTFLTSKIISRAISFEESKIPENNKRLNKSIDYMVSLYKRGMESKNKRKKDIFQNREKIINFEKKMCSFKPKHNINRNIDNKFKKEFANSNIYQRGIKYQQNKLKKLAKLYEEKQQYMEIFPFHPEISHKDLNKVFNCDNFFREQADNDSNKIFLFRLLKAREEEENRKNNIFTRKYGDNFESPKKGKLNREISQKDSVAIKKKLHKMLMSYKNLEIKNEHNIDNN